MGETPMEIACMRSNVETIEIMLESTTAERLNDNKKYDNQWSPVHCCCINGNVQVLKMLLDSGLDYSSQNVWKQTPLHICAVKGYVESAKMLINKYDRKELLMKDEFGKTAERIAAMNHKQQVVQLIRKRMRALKEKKALINDDVNDDQRVNRRYYNDRGRESSNRMSGGRKTGYYYRRKTQQ